MKRILHLFLLFICCLGQNAIAQDDKVNEILNWVIKKDLLKPLNYQTNVSCFYGMSHQDALKVNGIIDYAGNSLSNKCLKDFITDEEAESFHSQVKQLVPVRWKKTHYKLNTRFYVSDERDGDETLVHFLSLPIFLDKEPSRFIIGEGFAGGAGFGRGDLILCELKKGQWAEIARVNIWND